MATPPVSTDAPALPLSGLCAILVIDLVDSVPLFRRHGHDAIERWNSFVHEVRQEVLPRHELQLVNSLGDGLRLLAGSAAAAVHAAIDMRARLAPYNKGRDADALMRIHAGVEVADVVLTELDVFGHGVNVAARLAGNSLPDEILLTATANESLLPGIDPPTEDLGDRWLKGLAEPVRAFRVVGATAGDEPGRPFWADDRVLWPTIAVLPFDNPGDDSGLQIGELLADDLICALSLLPNLHVVSRLSTSALARRAPASPAAAAVLHADFVLTGSCRPMGANLLVHAELFDSRRAEVVFRGRETATRESLLGAESPIVNRLIAACTEALLAQQIKLTRRCAVPNLAGYSLLLGGIALMHRLGQRDFARAGQLLAELCERWPRLAAPHAWRARWHLFNVLQTSATSPETHQRAAHEISQRALDLDPESSVALAVAGSVRTGLARDVDGGLALYERALQANPNDSFAWTLHGAAHAFKGEGGIAQRSSSMACRLSPLDPMHFLYDCHAASAALAAEDHENARTLALRSMRANAQHLSTFRVLAISQMLCGDGDGARQTVARLRRLDPAASVERFLSNSPSAAYPIGKRFAGLLAEAGMPQGS